MNAALLLTMSSALTLATALMIAATQLNILEWGVR